MTYLFRQITALVILFFLQACGQSEKERMTIIELTKEMQTHCIGRYLIDLPKSFEPMKISGVNTLFSPAGVDFQEAPKMTLEVFKKDVSPEQFKVGVDQRITKLKMERHAYKKEEPLFAFAQKNSDYETLIRRQEADAPDGGYYFSEIHLQLAQIYAVTQAKSYENKFAVAEKWLTEFAHSISPLTSATSTQKGFCVGPLVVNGNYGREVVDFAFRSKKYPDIFITIAMDTFGNNAETTLLQRANDPKNLLKKFDVSYSTLRKGELKVGTMKAQEVLVSFKDTDEDGKPTKEHKLMLETSREKPSAAEPKISLRISTGQQDPQGERHTSSLSDQEAMGIWDAIIKSIRLRPGAV
jgi:Tle cognate immunity protein 4 C-terminal domain/Tle cognate immunity protein 4 N-terminal domain